mmetsp:Transcript_14657/g.34138  ORF Transcript_14657/g.34138 Transcript_14657/m.34138 type:complete len:360 (-) Transcript_14657:1403-2482(-)
MMYTSGCVRVCVRAYAGTCGAGGRARAPQVERLEVGVGLERGGERRTPAVADEVAGQVQLDEGGVLDEHIGEGGGRLVAEPVAAEREQADRAVREEGAHRHAPDPREDVADLLGAAHRELALLVHRVGVDAQRGGEELAALLADLVVPEPHLGERGVALEPLGQVRRAHVAQLVAEEDQRAQRRVALERLAQHARTGGLDADAVEDERLERGVVDEERGELAHRVEAEWVPREVEVLQGRALVELAQQHRHRRIGDVVAPEHELLERAVEADGLRQHDGVRVAQLGRGEVEHGRGREPGHVERRAVEHEVARLGHLAREQGDEDERVHRAKALAVAQVGLHLHQPLAQQLVHRQRQSIE